MQLQRTCRMSHRGATCTHKNNRDQWNNWTHLTDDIHSKSQHDLLWKKSNNSEISSVMWTWPHSLIHVRTNVLTCQTSWKEPSGMTNPAGLWSAVMSLHASSTARRRVTCWCDAYHTRSTSMWRKFLNRSRTAGASGRLHSSRVWMALKPLPAPAEIGGTRKCPI